MKRKGRIVGKGQRQIWRGLLALALLGLAGEAAEARTLRLNYTWSGYEARGKSAGICEATVPEGQPLATSRTLIVDNNLPNGTVLHAWGYGEFLPTEFIAACIRGELNTIRISGANPDQLVFYDQYGDNKSPTSGLIVLNPVFLNPVPSSEISPGIYRTSINGIGIRIFAKVVQQSDGPDADRANFYIMTPTGEIQNPAPGVEYPLAFTGTGTPSLAAVASNRPGSQPSSYGAPDIRTRVSYRAELVKTGKITTSGALSVPEAASPVIHPTHLGAFPPYLGGAGIMIQLVECRLRGATDYSVDLGNWESKSGTLPYTGDTQLIDINLECSGKLNNVRFAFQDTGENSLAGRNISLYDSTGGQPVEGLEVELTYGGARVNVHQAGETIKPYYRVNVGDKGVIKNDTSDGSYLPESTSFGVRFVQRARITRNGSVYTGPVTGKVNMFVTYD